MALKSIKNCTNTYNTVWRRHNGKNEDEQSDLKNRISEPEHEIASEKEKFLNLNHFLSLVKKYMEVPELTAEIIREFIEKVYVYHPEKIDGQKNQRVRIGWNYIGEIPAQTNNKTA